MSTFSLPSGAKCIVNETEGPQSPTAIICPGRGGDLKPLKFIVNLLATRGFRVVGLQYRGSDSSHDDGDLREALSKFGEETLLICHSRGAMAALRSIAHSKNVSGIVALNPIMNLPLHLKRLSDFSLSLGARFNKQYGVEHRDDIESERIQRLSPHEYLGNTGPSTLILGGANDFLAPVDEIETTLKLAKDSGRENVEFALVDGLGHFFEGPYSTDRSAEVGAIIESWLAKADLQSSRSEELRTS